MQCLGGQDSESKTQIQLTGMSGPQVEAYHQPGVFFYPGFGVCFFALPLLFLLFRSQCGISYRELAFHPKSESWSYLNVSASAKVCSSPLLLLLLLLLASKPDCQLSLNNCKFLCIWRHIKHTTLLCTTVSHSETPPSWRHVGALSHGAGEVAMKTRNIRRQI